MTEHRRPDSSVRRTFAREDWNARYAGSELVWTAEPNRRFASEVESLPPGRALDHVRQGIAVFDKSLHLVCWNRQFGEILALPPQLTRVGTGLDDILRFHAESKMADKDAIDSLVREAEATRLARREGYREGVWSLLDRARQLDTPAVNRDELRHEAVQSLGDFDAGHQRFVKDVGRLAP